MKTLVAYFSWSGTTKKIAETLAKKTNADLFEIRRKKPYSSDYNETAYGDSKTEAEKDLRPEIQGPLPDLNKYDRVITAFPIWWYTSPKTVQTFYESYPDWQGKKLYVFADSYSDIPSQFTNALNDAKKSAKNATVIAGLYNKDIDRKLDQWLKENAF